MSLASPDATLTDEGKSEKKETWRVIADAISAITLHVFFSVFNKAVKTTDLKSELRCCSSYKTVWS